MTFLHNEKSERKIVFVTKKHLTFVHAHAILRTIFQKALTKTVRQADLQRVGVWCEPAIFPLRTYPF